jgi:hypothetical protein
MRRYRRTGCDAAKARMSELERDMQPLDGIVGLFTIASFVAREGYRPPGSNGLVVDLRQDRDQTNPGCRQW